MLPKYHPKSKQCNYCHLESSYIESHMRIVGCRQINTSPAPGFSINCHWYTSLAAWQCWNAVTICQCNDVAVTFGDFANSLSFWNLKLWQTNTNAFLPLLKPDRLTAVISVTTTVRVWCHLVSFSNPLASGSGLVERTPKKVGIWLRRSFVEKNPIAAYKMGT